MSFKLKLPPFENVVASQTAILPRLPRGNMYDAIIFALGGGNTQANMSNIRLIVNGKTVWNIEGADLDLINNYDRLQDTATFLACMFSDLDMNGQVQSQLGALDTSRGVEEFSIEVDLGAGVAPTLRADALVSPPSPKGDRFANMFKSVLKATQAPAAAGQFNFPVPLGSRAGGFVRRVHFLHANITSLAVKRDGVNLMDDLVIADINYINGLRHRTTQAGLVVFDPISESNPEDMVPTLRGDRAVANFEFLPTVSAADTVKTYTELLASLANI
jgi:hypothetical protein